MRYTAKADCWMKWSKPQMECVVSEIVITVDSYNKELHWDPFPVGMLAGVRIN